MSVTIELACSGCTATIRRDVHQTVTTHGQATINGVVCDRVSTRIPSINRVFDGTGWVPFDPYTGCCYCEDCWESIEAGSNP